LQLHLCRPA